MMLFSSGSQFWEQWLYWIADLQSKSNPLWQFSVPAWHNHNHGIKRILTIFRSLWAYPVPNPTRWPCLKVDSGIIFGKSARGKHPSSVCGFCSEQSYLPTDSSLSIIIILTIQLCPILPCVHINLNIKEC